MYDYIIGGSGAVLCLVWLLVADVLPRAKRNADRRKRALETARLESMSHHPAGKRKA